ncbi:hypothetical protein [Parasphingorhabdus litoris]|uniref:hypothetical protein n=1 Tax=Parasphingorhabdus litoris TaxID=394733 RepID=UPI001E420C7D|nr:hypothetical protein [Parasphingorhabdus litoris]
MSATPEPKFGFYPQYIPPSPLEYLTWGGQSLLLITMIFIFFFIIASKRREVIKKEKRYEFSAYTLKFISFFSILFGLSIFIFAIQNILVKAGIAGNAYLGQIATPISDALTPLVFGLFNATVGLSFYFFARWRNLRALESKEES